MDQQDFQMQLEN